MNPNDASETMSSLQVELQDLAKYVLSLIASPDPENTEEQVVIPGKAFYFKAGVSYYLTNENGVDVPFTVNDIRLINFLTDHPDEKPMDQPHVVSRVIDGRIYMEVVPLGSNDGNFYNEPLPAAADR